MQRLGVAPDEADDLQRVLCALLLLGNVQFAADSDDHARVANAECVAAAGEEVAHVDLRGGHAHARGA